MSFIEIATTSELTDGSKKMAKINGHELMIAQIGNNYYCTDNRCPHMGGNLSQGMLNGTVITCPRHGSQFDLADGHVIRWTNWSGIKKSIGKLLKSPRDLKTYNIKIEDEKILVDYK